MKSTNDLQGVVNVSTPATKMLAIGRWTENGLNVPITPLRFLLPQD